MTTLFPILCAARLAWSASGAGTQEAGMLELEGRAFGKVDTGAYSGPQQQTLALWKTEGDNTLSRTVHFPTRGVWYVWLKVRCAGPWPALLTYDLDGVQPLLSARKDILVQPAPGSAWLSWSRFPGFRIEVHVDEPGDHVLRFTRVSGNAEIDRILLTLFFSAKLSGDTLDLAGDPGGGSVNFPRGDLSVDGWRKDAPLADVKASGTAYYVDPEHGDDTGAGTSAAKAWKSLARVNAATFAPGDAILLKRGATFEEGLAPRGSGTEQAWITLASYGTSEHQSSRPRRRG